MTSEQKDSFNYLAEAAALEKRMLKIVTDGSHEDTMTVAVCTFDELHLLEFHGHIRIHPHGTPEAMRGYDSVIPRLTETVKSRPEV